MARGLRVRGDGDDELTLLCSRTQAKAMEDMRDSAKMPSVLENGHSQSQSQKYPQRGIKGLARVSRGLKGESGERVDDMLGSMPRLGGI